MTIKSLLRPALLACSIATSVGAAHASLVVYNTQASYLAAISSPGVDTFNSLPRATVVNSPLARTAGAYSYTASAGPNGFYPAGTLAGDIWLAANLRTDTVTFDAFSTGVVGVGGFFFRTSGGGPASATPASLSVMATDASGTDTEILVNPITTTFLGFVSTTGITSLKMWVGTQGVGTIGVYATVNDLTLGSALPDAPNASVPEPGTLALAGVAVLGLMAAQRSRRS